MTNHHDPEQDEALDVASLETETRGGGQPHTQNDLLGLLPGGGGQSPLDSLNTGSDEFIEWAARGNRTKRERVAEVQIVYETAALNSENFPVRGPMMKAARKQNALLTILSVPRTPMSKMEFWLIIAGFAAILGTLFLITTMVTE